jgi:tripartite motif-containing protein 71
MASSRKKARVEIEPSELNDRKFVAMWGTEGSGDGQFIQPTGIATSVVDGNIYVSDTGNHRIQCFQPNGTFIRKWGNEGKGDGDLSSPTGLAMGLFDGMDKAIKVEADKVPELRALPPGVLPICISYVGDEQLCVCDEDRIQVFTRDGQFVRKWMDDSFGPDFRCAVSEEGEVYVVNTELDYVKVFRGDGTLVRKWNIGQSVHVGRRVGGIAIAKAGTVYVSSQSDNWIRSFLYDGTYKDTRMLGSVTCYSVCGKRTESVIPLSIAINANGTIVYVADEGNYRILRLRTDHHTLTAKWGKGYGDESRYLGCPSGIAIGRNGRIYVADLENNRIAVLFDDMLL